MAQRSITDTEIAYMKAMLARGMSVTDIQFFFNRPDRKVNTGRITGIQKGDYSNSAEIQRASDGDLNNFLARHTPSAEIPGFATANTDALAPKVLRRMFAKKAKAAWILSSGETDQAECKTSFGLKYAGPWLRAIAALANNRGGYVFFGVRDKNANGDHEVVGLSGDEFTRLDPADLAQRLRSTFDPTPRFQKDVVKLGRLSVGVIYVDQHPSRPVIATKNEDGIREGDIFFRYPGQSTRISYGDLRAMLDARDEQARKDILPMVQRLLTLGPSRAMIADLTDGRLMDGKHTIELDESVIRGLAFIKEGEFNEKSGAPALRLIGNVKAAATSTGVPVKKGLVTRVDMQRDFLADELQADPHDYVSCAVEVSGNDWLPIRHFAKAAGMSLSALLSFIDSKGLSAQKKLYKQRLSSPDKAYMKAPRSALPWLDRILKGEELVPNNLTEARDIALAIQAIKRPLALDPKLLKALLLRCFNIINPTDDGYAKSAIRKALARLDELLSEDFGSATINS